MLEPGDHALFRFVWPGKVFWALPGTVVEHTAERVGLWVAPGTPFQRPPTIPVPVSRLAARDWTHSDERWFGGGVLMLHEFGASHSIWPRWDEQGAFGGWYVNLEDPWRVSPLGFDTTDHALDIEVAPDRTWRWKDEDHFAEGVEVGLYSAEQARMIREEGERLVERIEAWTAPFDEGWERWRPDPDWPVPAVPEGWDRL